MLAKGNTAMDGTSGCVGMTTVGASGEPGKFRSSASRSVTDWHRSDRSFRNARVITLWTDDDDPLSDGWSCSRIAFEIDNRFSP